MKKFLAVILITLFACSPKHSKWDAINKKLSVYYGEPLDTMKNQVTIRDSASIKTLNLKFLYFTKQKALSDSITQGELIIDLKTDNFYVCSWHGIIGAFTFGKIQSDSYERENCNTLHKFTFGVNSWQIPLLESILNNLPISTKRSITRNVLDSFFRFSYKGMGAYKSSWSTIDLIGDKNIFDSIFIKNFVEIYRKDSDLYFRKKREDRALFKTFADSLFINGDPYLYFQYRNNPQYVLLFTINEDFKNDSLAQNYTEEFTNEEKLYNLKLYNVSQ